MASPSSSATAIAPPRFIHRRCSSSTSTASGRWPAAHLGFEYFREEFAGPALRHQQVERYLSQVPKDKPIFLWVHLFEPHEPYEMHPEHPFSGEPKVDAYDSEIAEADAVVGDVEALVAKYRPRRNGHDRQRRPRRGARRPRRPLPRHDRVRGAGPPSPLVIAAPGLAPRVVTPPVQTIDLLPTTLAALDVPLPPRLGGRDLGPSLAGLAPASDRGFGLRRDR